MKYLNNSNHTYIYESLENYNLFSKDVLLHKNNLSKEDSVKYFLNKNELEMYRDLSEELKINYNNFSKYITKISNTKYDRFPFQISLIGDKKLEKYKYEIRKNFSLLETKLITNDHNTYNYMIDQLKNELLTCDSFDIIVSFIRGSGLNMLVNTLNILRELGIKGRIITSTYMNVTQPEALRKLLEYKNIDVKIYQSSKIDDSFHTKAYLFHRKNNMNSVIVGSSNITKAALKTGEEWNIRTYEKASDSVYISTQERYDILWNSDKVVKLSDELISKYENFIEVNKVIYPISQSFNIKKTNNNIIQPNSMQKEAIKNLLISIDKGHKRGIAIAATGTGKTYLSAMAAQKLNPRNVLFIAHRNELLESGMKTFKKIFNDQKDDEFAKYKGEQRIIKKYTFASIKTLVKDIGKMEPETFDIIIIDEFHHATASNYMKVINHFSPRFLLGLTATPERTDGGDVYELAEYNVISDVRLKHALESELLVPFQYYGISDDTVDLADRDGISVEEITKKLSTNKRVEFIIKKMNQFTLSGPMKAIGFCQNIVHAQYMNEEFKKRGYYSTILTGNNTDEERQEAINDLQSNKNSLEIIFTVDLFNEGVDIPQINLILFLRPTESSIIFTQQLGRGLRTYANKEYLTVLDFVTNDRKNYLVPIALSGDPTFMGRGKLKSIVENNFNNLSNQVHIELDYKSKEDILKNIDNTTFYSAENIKRIVKSFLEEVRIIQRDNDYTLNILDFYNFENAPDLFTVFSGSYNNLSQLNKSIKSQSVIDDKINNDSFYTFIFNEVTKILPLRRIFDYIILLDVLINNKSSTKNIKYLFKEMLSIELDKSSIEKIEYSIERLTKLKYKKQPFLHLTNYEITLDKNFKVDDDVRLILKDYLQYGFFTYKKEFEPKLINREIDLYLYEQYKRTDVLALIGYNKAIDSLREGVLQYKGNYYLFVNLFKDEEAKENKLNYQDYFINNSKFHWQSQNQTSQSSPTGQNLIHHVKNNKKVHLFVRREKKEEGVVMPFYYVGELEFVSASGNKPISIEWNLKKEIPMKLLNEFTVNNEVRY
ncbi:DUF3427 domain-containing protein [Macrococcus psychrotolerans]|uniref:DUF3427 domain-containing protein n=1 Tax=Macrococcus psychrotolerans TaxID=3039389 RepID=A0AAT9P579_9STAP|nr:MULTISPECIES: DUF3427 domain-containing protein [Macrococcus]QYA32376.1 DUF3427 domain-containing protein [Macrococcus sp. 19Msa1099]QYA37183.1 DUF3427 domain-containing protein [Macrococcus caseolyticus]QYA75891.1 DUF3427 domain-containing protein [Macrococcus caseolyticus]